MMRNTLKHFFSILTVCVCAPVFAGEKFDIVKDGAPNASIVVPEKPSASAQLATAELVHHIQLITGVKIPVVTDKTQAKGPREPLEAVAQDIPQRRDGYAATVSARTKRLTTGKNVEKTTFKGIKIFVGDTKKARELGLNQGQFKKQEYVIKFIPEGIALVGKDADDFSKIVYDLENPLNQKIPSPWDAIGTAYAAYDFLRDYCGVHWVSSMENGTHYPQTQNLSVTSKDIRRSPFMLYRCDAWMINKYFWKYDAVSSLWHKRSEGFKEAEEAAYPSLHAKYPNKHKYQKAKNQYLKLFLVRARYGGEWLNGNHSLYNFYNRFWAKNPKYPDVFVKHRPELFAKGYDSAAAPAQLCYTNQATVDQVVQDACDYFAGKSIHHNTGEPTPGEYYWGKDYYSVTPMDNVFHCKCENCQKLLKPRNGANHADGSASNLIFSFINKVAKEVGKRYPHKWIYCNAYAANTVPPDFPLEKNVVVRFCFTANRGPDSPIQDAQKQLIKDWHSVLTKSGNPLFLVMFNTFPVESANNGNWYCFPGFFGTKLAKQYNFFSKNNIRGVNNCGFGQEVENYISLRMADNPELNGEQLIDEYFALYGKAGEPLKNMYLMMEDTFLDLKNYPKGHYRETFNIAWGRLGTEERMKKLSEFMEQAEKSAKTPVEKQRVEFWKKAVWDYMLKGQRKFQERMKTPIPEFDIPDVSDAKGNPDAVDWNKAAVLSDWYRKSSAESANRKLTGKIAHDDNYLYLQLEDPCDSSNLITQAKVFPFDCWEIFLAKERGGVYRHYAVSPSGNMVCLSNFEVNFRRNVEMPDLGIVASSHKEEDKWITNIAFPLKTVVADGVKPGDKIYLNVTRCANSTLKDSKDPGRFNSSSWVSYTKVHETDRLAELYLRK